MKRKITLSLFIFIIMFVLITDDIKSEVIKITHNSIYGNIITDGDGMTLYFFTKDKDTSTSVCTGGCVTLWPIFYDNTLVIGEGLDSADFSEIVRSDGLPQVTYKGWPLYYYSSDTQAGDVKGENFGGVWYVAKPDYTIMLLNNQLVGNDGVQYNSHYQPGTENVQYFVDGYGRTLYTFKIDTYNKNNFTAEDFSNNGFWPIFEETLHSVPSVLDTNLFATANVFGHKQLTYKGWPLYYFGPDAMKRGNTKGVSVPTPGVWPVARTSITGAPQKVILANDSKYGSILTDGAGRTLYFFTKDKDTSTSECNNGCVAVWPIFYSDSLIIGEGLESKDFGEIIRSDGLEQTTYKGWPLYYYAGDSNAGDVTGENVGGVWYVAKPDYTIMLMNNQLVGNNGIEYNGQYQPGKEVVQYFVDAYGNTLYTFNNDTYNDNNFTKEDFSNNGFWPIFEQTRLSVPSIIDTTLFSTIDVFGHHQLTFKGWPLYYFGPDSMIRGKTKGVSVPTPGVWPVAQVSSKEAPVKIQLVDNEEYGKIMTDGAGMTLYFFTKDVDTSKSVCNGQCEDFWPVFYAASLSAGPGLESEDFHTITRDDGTKQTTYKGWPLYYYAGDTTPGDVSGENVSGVWFIAKADYNIMLLNKQLVGNDGVEYNSSYQPGKEVTQFFVDGYGRTLYTFKNDRYNDNNYTNPDFSNNGFWPIYEESHHSVPSVIDTNLFSQIDVFGRTQLTYKGWPLYYFGPDSMKKGNTKGVSVPSPGIWPVATKNADSATVTGVDDAANLQPKEYSLAQNFPNPFNPSTKIKFSIINSERVTLRIYNSVGQLITELVNKVIPAGNYDITWNAGNVPSGIYFYSISTNNFRQTKKMVLLK